MTRLHIALIGPIGGADIAGCLDAGSGSVPTGYTGAPLTGILAVELLRLGHRVTAITTDALLPLNGGPVSREGPDFRFIACPARRRAWRFNGLRPGRAVDLFAFERQALTRVLVETAPDIVHAHWTYEFALAALAQQQPCLVTCHDSPGAVLRYTRSPYRALRWLMAREVFRRGQHFTTVSDYMARTLAPALGGAPAVVPNPVAAEAYTLGRARARPATRRVAMVCNGWSRFKNPEAGLQGFALWRTTEPTAELHLYGAEFGPGERAQAWAHAAGLEGGLHFHGRLPHHRLIEQVSAMDALLHPALEESFGVVIAEAMALGMPIVAGQHSGAVPSVVRQAADGRVACGALVDVRDERLIARALAEVFDAGYALRSAAGIEAAQPYRATEVAREYQRHYELIVGSAGSPIRPAAKLPGLHAPAG